MPDRYTYLLVDIVCIIFPFACSFHPKINFHRQWRFFALPCVVTALFFLVWDALFARAGIWSFNPRYVVGLRLAGLPLEEYLFFFCIPYACVFTYYCVAKFIDLSRFQRTTTIFSYSLVAALLILALLFPSLLYTSITFLLLSVFLYFTVMRKHTFLPSFFAAFLIILLPFFISNGILTGTGLPEPVVMYNNHYNSGIRLLTIPVEDTFYGMLLMLMNVIGFNYLSGRASQ